MVGGCCGSGGLALLLGVVEGRNWVGGAGSNCGRRRRWWGSSGVMASCCRRRCRVVVCFGVRLKGLALSLGHEGWFGHWGSLGLDAPVVDYFLPESVLIIRVGVCKRH